MAVKPVSLKTVSKRAFEDAEFFNELIKNPEKALGKANLRLRANDLKRLKLGLRKKSATVTIKDYRKFIRGYHSKDVRWPPTWPINTWELPAVKKARKRARSAK
jgi:hypothetical protein